MEQSNGCIDGGREGWRGELRKGGTDKLKEGRRNRGMN